jgi:hypothetical protein
LLRSESSGQERQRFNAEKIVPPTKLSLRALWTIYKRTAIAQGIGSSRRDLTLAHVAFYSGARGVLRVLDYMLEHGEEDKALQTIRRFGRQIKVIQRHQPRHKLQ